ncbi:DUF2813 domain-containing protein [Lacihabitans sp. CCS-44]|uniref:ATP-dependent nuclease n=1 Tax=Lacihabitans sp. CCS-44 TaxID=2487331 RepID=UPI0020CE5FB0|nr:AAA family ATPase [Lacihabitans sp. CCS-44]MCP9755185.1 DUF2813 domain-containing protein [Lacihabitans sp. CCS-44]
MKIDRIEISNFRSIKAASIKLDSNCIILIGKNEAGKSNILKAIASVFGEYKISESDKRKKIKNEIIENYYVRVIYKLSDNDLKEIEDTILENYSNIEAISFDNNYTLTNFIKFHFSEILQTVSIQADPEIKLSYWATKNKPYKFSKDLFLTNSKFFNHPDEGKKVELVSEIFATIKEIFGINHTKCHYWKYSDEFLLPDRVNIVEFTTRPSEFKSLQNIFSLCGRNTIKKEFEDAKLQDGDYSNLLDQVSEGVTEVFQNIWEDLKETKISLIPDGNEILIKVVNNAKYTFSDRSDGFKKYISILLMLSTQSRSNIIGNEDIILIDEPDQSLYPTSAFHLKEELLRISEKTPIIYSTHSQYMIDSERIDRHYIVKKHKDITTIEKPSENSPFGNDELLRRAIGTSLFEVLKNINLVFEGWLDKEFFLKYCVLKNKSKDFNKYGMTYLKGISVAETIIPILNLANKKYIIISDSDQISKSKRKELENTYKDPNGSWVSYGDIDNSIETLEDFYNKDYFIKELNEFGKFKINVEHKNSHIIEKLDIEKSLKQIFKNNLKENFSENDILPAFELFLTKLNESIKKLK